MRGINHHDDWGWANASRKGSSGGGGNTQTTVSNTQPPPEFQAGLSTALQQGQAAAATPFQNYPGQLQAGFSPQQQQGFDLVGSTPGLAAPYINAAAQHFDAATTPLWQGLPQFNAGQIAQYSNPYTSNVIDATQRRFNDQNAQAANQLQGNAASRGALGGDRAGVAQAVLRGQEEFSQAPVIAGLQSQNYQQALQEFNQQQQAKLTADSSNAWLNNQAATGFGALGNEALNTTLTSAAALTGAGNQQQAQAQQSLNIPYQQFLQQQSYPFQTSAWLSGLSAQLANAAGGTASTSAPGPSPISQFGGAALGTAGLAGSLFGKNGAFPGALNNLFGSSNFADGSTAGFVDQSAGTFSGISPAVDAALQAAGGARGGAIHRAPGGSVPSMGDDPFLSSLGAGGLGDVMEPGGFGVPLGGGTRDANGGATVNLNPDVSVSVVGPPPNPGQPSMAKQSTTTGSGGGGGGSGFGQAVGTAAGLVNVGRGIASLIALLNRGGAVPHRAPGGPVTVTSGISPRTGFLLPMISVDSGSGSGTADALNAFLATTKAGAFVPPPFVAPFNAPASVAPPPAPFFGGLGNGVVDQSFVGGGAGGNSEGGGGGGGPGGPTGGNDLGSGTNGPGATDSVGGASGAGNATEIAGGGSGDTSGGGADHSGETGGLAAGGLAGRHGFCLPHRAEGGFTSTDEDVPTLGDAPAMPGFGSVGDYVPRPSAKDQRLDEIMMRESRGQNIPNQQGPGGTPLSTASGYYQMIDSTWRENAKLAGVDTDQYPTAMSAPKGVQYQVASLLYDREGERPWAASAPGEGTTRERNLAPEPADSGQQSGATGSAGLSEPPVERAKIHQADPWLALAEAGFAMASGRSPFALQNIGAGAVAGIRAFKSDQKEAEALAIKVEDARARLAETSALHGITAQHYQTDAELRRQQMKQTERHQTEETGLRRQEIGLRQQALEQGKYTYQSGLGPDPNDPTKQVDGVYKLPTRGDEQPTFLPGTKLTQKASPTGTLLSDETKDQIADRLIAGDQGALAGLGYGNTGAQNRAAVQESVTRKLRASGLGGADLAARTAAYMGERAGARTAATREANVGMAVNEAVLFMPLALDASSKVDRTQFPTLNAVTQAFEKGTGDENIVRLQVATNSLINAYARAITPSGIPTEGNQQRARELLDRAWSKGQYAAAVDQLWKEMQAAKKSPIQQQEEQRARISGRPATPAPSGGVPPLPPGVPPGSLYSASRKAWRTPSGEIIPHSGLAP